MRFDARGSAHGPDQCVWLGARAARRARGSARAARHARLGARGSARAARVAFGSALAVHAAGRKLRALGHTLMLCVTGRFIFIAWANEIEWIAPAICFLPPYTHNKTPCFGSKQYVIF